MRSAERNSIIASKRAARDKALALAGSHSANDHDVHITATATEIVQRIARGECTSSQVLEAYIARAAVAHAETNCVTEVLFEDARKQAKELDTEFSSTQQLRGLLHGVPISFKDQYEIEGYDATIGFTSFANKPATKDAFLVSQLKAAGAIIIVKTNVPQTMLAFECSNPLWGRTTNPWNDQFTCGGSSGGEAALVSMDGSVIGIGSDAGGSLRIPASYCGLFSFKSSAHRVSTQGAKGGNPGFEAIPTVMGPLARSVQDCELFCRIIYGQQDSTHRNIPLPYRPVELPSKLRFGYYLSEGLVQPSPACQRAVLETVSALEKQGHECIEFTCHLAVDAMETFIALASADGYKGLMAPLGSDPKETSLFLVLLGAKIPSIVRRLICFMADTFVGDSAFSRFFGMVREKTVWEFLGFTNKRNQVAAAWYEEVWDKYGFDGIIAPVQSLPVIPHGGSAYLSPLAIATVLYNVVDSPVGVVPVTRVDPDADQLPADFDLGAPGRSKVFEQRMYGGKKPIYDAKAMQGIPVGVQIVGKKWEDEKVLAMMDVVDKALGPRGFGPGSWKPKPKE